MLALASASRGLKSGLAKAPPARTGRAITQYEPMVGSKTDVRADREDRRVVIDRAHGGEDTELVIDPMIQPEAEGPVVAIVVIEVA